MHLCEWKIAEDEAKFFAEMFLDAFHDGVGVAAMRAFVIAILDQSAFRIRTSLDMVLITYRNA